MISIHCAHKFISLHSTLSLHRSSFILPMSQQCRWVSFNKLISGSRNIKLQLFIDIFGNHCEMSAPKILLVFLEMAAAQIV